MKLKKLVNRIRINSLLSIYFAKSGHPGGSLSCADILTFLFFKEMRIEISNEGKMLKDRFILSKGHAVPAFYSVALELGLINFEDL